LSSRNRITLTKPKSLEAVMSETGDLIQPTRKEQDQISPTVAATATGANDPLIDLEEVGLPTDGLWEHEAAYEKRFCYEHGENEYLIRPLAKWMRPSDFGIATAQDKLDVLFRKFWDQPSRFQPQSRQCQAECRSSLWSSIYRVVDKNRIGEEMAYLIQWKVCWIPGSNIDDGEWVVASLKATNQHRRHSARLSENEEERLKRMEEVMVVVRIADYLS